MSAGVGRQDSGHPLRRGFLKLWDSPTFMTWGSFLSRPLSLVIVLPLLLTRLSTEEIAVWYLFMTIVGLQMLVDIGFSPSFSRGIAYALGGAAVGDLRRPARPGTGTPNLPVFFFIFSSMSGIYTRLAIAWPGVLLILGSAAVARPISLLSEPRPAWAAWAVILVVSTVTIWGNAYSAYLQGINRVALLRRWEMLSSLGAITTSFCVLLFGGRLLALVLAHQGWQLLNVLRNRWLARTVDDGRWARIPNHGRDPEVFGAVWPSAWRSGLGVLMSYGLIQASGILYAQVGAAAQVASYLLALRLIQTVSQFSQAPFYSKLPVLARLFSEGRKQDLLALAKRGMRWAHWSYVAGFLGLGLLGTPLLHLIGSNADFPSRPLWALLGLAFFIERYGAMHIQLYSTTNHIIWHIANGVTGVIYVVTSLLLFQHIGVYAFPVGILCGYLGFYSWYAALHSYQAFDLSFFRFEKSTVLLPLGMVLLYTLGAFATSQPRIQGFPWISLPCFP